MSEFELVNTKYKINKSLFDIVDELFVPKSSPIYYGTFCSKKFNSVVLI